MEFVIVRFPRKRDVRIDGDDSGDTGEVLRVNKGRHTFDLGSPRDYKPSRRTRTVQNTTSIKPMEIAFEEI